LALDSVVVYVLNAMNASNRVFFIVASVLLSLGFVGAAYFLSGNGLARVNAESTEELLREYAAKDSDSDGLPDWQETLYGSDPENAHSIDPNLTDRQAVDQGLVEPKFRSEELAVEDIPDIAGATSVAPDTLTDRFARSFFEDYMLGLHGSSPTAEAVSAFAEKTVAELSSEAASVTAFSIRDVNIGTQGGPDALRAYATAAETAILSNSSRAAKDEISYFQDVVTKNDTSAAKRLETIAGAYERTVAALMRISVPPEVAASHVRMVNVVKRIGIAVSDMAAFQKDPLRTMVGLGSYNQATNDFTVALTETGKVFDRAGAVIQKGEPGFYFYATLILGTAEANRLNSL